MAPDYLMATRIEDADLILLQALLMNMREVPSYHYYRANNTTTGLQIGSMLSVKKLMCLPTIGLSQIHFKASSTSVRIVFESRAKCQDLDLRLKR